MKSKNILKHLVVGVALAVSGMPAFAQWAVFDPTNFVQNYSQALSGIKNEINTAKTLIQETQTAVNMAKSVKGLEDMDGLAQAKEALKLYKDLKAVDSLLEKDFQQSAELTERVASKYGASDMSWNEYLNNRSELEKQQRETSAQRYRAINASIEHTSQQRQAIVGKLGAVQGQTEAMQTLGAAIDVLIGQNQQIISILASNSRVDEIKRNDEATLNQKGDAEAVKSMNGYQRRLREAARKY